LSTNPTHLEQQNQTEQQNKAPVSSIRTHSGFTLWLDGLRCKLTVHAWRRRTKKARRRHSFRQVLARVPHANLIGDALYMIGFRTRLISHIRSSST
jgi:chloramphenicol 3-O-phosphotransferase